MDIMEKIDADVYDAKKFMTSEELKEYNRLYDIIYNVTVELKLRQEALQKNRTYF